VKLKASERTNPLEFGWRRGGTEENYENIVEDLQYLSLYAKLGSLIYRAGDLPLNRMCSVRFLTVNNFHERHTMCKVLQT
jgi:hypothetical protein